MVAVFVFAVWIQYDGGDQWEEMASSGRRRHNSRTTEVLSLGPEVKKDS